MPLIHLARAAVPEIMTPYPLFQAQRPEQSVMQALESLSDNQVRTRPFLIWRARFRNPAVKKYPRQLVTEILRYCKLCPCRFFKLKKLFFVSVVYLN